MVLTKQTEKFDRFYWRAPSGSGKTVFLTLMEKELQSRGCDVYMLETAGDLETFDKMF